MLGVVVFSALTGCASVTEGMTQSMKVETLATKGGSKIDGADCRLTNERETIATQSGQVANVRRWRGNMDIRCTLDGYAPAVGHAIPRANAGVVGNILIGGVVGAAVDLGTGAAFTYPTWVQLVFGEERIFDRSGHRDDSVTAGRLIRATGTAVAANEGGAVARPVRPVAPIQTLPLGRPAEAQVSAAAVAVSMDAKVDSQPLRKSGKDSYNAEKLAEANSCGVAPQASMTGQGPGFENYVVACSSGQVMTMRCEFGNCRVLAQ